MPGIGFGSGVERILLAANAPEEGPKLDVFFVTLTPEARLPAFRLATSLRAEGLACDLDYADRSAKGQFKQADRAGARYVDVSDTLEGHELCTADSWVFPIGVGSVPSYWAHPTAKGQQAIADRVADALS